MPLIPEDGTGLPDADTFVSLDDADAFYQARNIADWTGASSSDREAALRQAATYLGMVYRWPGQPVAFDQALPWPRALVPSGGGYFASDQIPRQIIDAQLLLALEAIKAPDKNLLRRSDPTPQVIEQTKAMKRIEALRRRRQHSRRRCTRRWLERLPQRPAGARPVSFVQEMADLAHELLDEGDETFGEDVVVTRPDAGGYDPSTRRRTGGTPQAQTLRGTFDDPGLTPAGMEGGLAERHDRICTCAPALTGGFEPRKADQVAGEGRTYEVSETAHIVKQGIPVLWVMGLKRA
jgi:hypothetical protein